MLSFCLDLSLFRGISLLFFLSVFSPSKQHEYTNLVSTTTMKYTIATGNSHSEDYEQYNKSEMATGKMLLYSSCLLQMYIPFDSISFTFKAYCYEHFFLFTRPLTPCNFALSFLMPDCHTQTHALNRREKIVQGNLCKLCIVTQRISFFDALIR